MIVDNSTPHPLTGRKVWIPRMSHISARMMAAVFRSIGVDASPTPASNEDTLKLGAMYTSGEECYPEKVTMGDFLRIIRSDDFDPDRTAFFMPTAQGPCRFGQYSPYLRQVLDELGYSNVPIVAPTSENGYDGMGEHASGLVRTLWRALVAGDSLRKLLLMTRPYETRAGAAEEAYEQSVRAVEAALQTPGQSPPALMAALVGAMGKARAAFEAVPARYEPGRPLIGVVGEIFCRLNTFSNYEAVRKIEAHGGEAWISDIAEWVWYTNWAHGYDLGRHGRRFSLAMLGNKVKQFFQRRDEHKIVAPLHDFFRGYEEPGDVYKQALKPAWPYLPANGARGEMTLSVGKAIYLYGKGADGIVDISPFACMNGIVSEGVYHTVAADHEDIPIRNFYFDSTTSNMDRDLDIFMELAQSYQKRKTRRRQYPARFEA